MFRTPTPRWVCRPGRRPPFSPCSTGWSSGVNSRYPAPARCLTSSAGTPNSGGCCPSGRRTWTSPHTIRIRAATRPAVQPRSAALLAWAGSSVRSSSQSTFLAQEAFRREEFDPITEVVSALEAGPDGWIQQANFVAFGVLTMAFAAGLHLVVRSTPRGSSVRDCCSSAGSGCCWPLPYRCARMAGVTYDPGGHVVAGLTFFLSSALGLIVLSRRLAATRGGEYRHLHAGRGMPGTGRICADGRSRDAGRCPAPRLGRPDPTIPDPRDPLSVSNRSLGETAHYRPPIVIPHQMINALAEPQTRPTNQSKRSQSLIVVFRAIAPSDSELGQSRQTGHSAP